MHTGCDILIKTMEDKFESRLSGDYQFKSLFEKIGEIEEINRIEDVISVEYHKINDSRSYGSIKIGKFDIECVEFYHLHKRKYEIILEYVYDGECIPTRPSLHIKGGELLTELHIR